MLERQRGTSLRSIAEQLDRSPSTLCRELKRNQPDKRAYCATQAAKAYNIRRKSSVKPRKLSRGLTLCDIDESLEDIGNDG
jgi:IS30 family transposase